MGSYTVNIAPEDGGGPQTTIRIDVRDGVARITELVVRPSAERDATDQLSGIDFDALMRVVQPAIAAIESVSAAAEPAATPAAPAVRSVAPQRARVATAPAAGQQKASLRPRAYRRIPTDLADTFAELGSVTKVAAHYGVPRHTAQGWINRLRREAE